MKDAKEVSELTLSQFKFVSEVLIPKQVVDSAKITSVFNEEINAWCLKLNSYIWSEQVSEEIHEVVFNYPASLWEHFKLHWPLWLQKMFPVKISQLKHQVTMEKVAVYPNLPLMVEDAEDGEYILLTRCKEDKLIQ